jgi:hypothetical protein
MSITPTQMKALRDMIGSEYDGVTAPCSSYRPTTIGALVRAGLVTAERKSWGYDPETGKWRLMPMTENDRRRPDATVWRITDAGRAMTSN